MSLPILFQSSASIWSIAFPACIFLVLVNLSYSFGKILRGGWINLQKVHQIPCHRCVYFTGNYNLKCTVHPYNALNEAAIDCSDYQPVQQG